MAYTLYKFTNIILYVNSPQINIWGKRLRTNALITDALPNYKCTDTYRNHCLSQDETNHTKTLSNAPVLYTSNRTPPCLLLYIYANGPVLWFLYLSHLYMTLNYQWIRFPSMALNCHWKLCNTLSPLGHSRRQKLGQEKEIVTGMLALSYWGCVVVCVIFTFPFRDFRRPTDYYVLDLFF